MRLIVVGLVCVLVVGCASPARGTPDPSQIDRSGGTLRVGLVHLWEQRRLENDRGETLNLALDPQTAYNGAELFRCCLARTLLSYAGKPGSDGGTRLVPDLATAFPDVSEDGRTWTFHLKRGIRYAPPMASTEVTAVDIIRAVERELTPMPESITARFPDAPPSLGAADFVFVQLVTGASAFAEGRASTVSGLEAPDPYTLRVHTDEPSADVPYVFALSDTTPIPANPAAPGDRLGVAQGHDATRGPFLVSTGPYMLEGAEELDFTVPADQQRPASGYREGQGFIFVRNPSWDPSTDDIRMAYPDRIEFTTWPSDDAGIAATEAGTIDLTWDAAPSHEQAARYTADPALQRRLIIEPNDVILIVFMNVAARPFDDVHVRKAMNLILDKARIHDLAVSLRADLAGPSGGRVATHLVVDSLEEYLLAGYRPYDAPDDHGSAVAAKAEMAQSAYDADRDGMCDATECASVRVVVRNSEPFWTETAKVISDGAAALGIHLEQEVVTVQEMFHTWGDPAQRLPMAIGIRFVKDYPTAAGVLPALFSSATFGAGNAAYLGASPEQLQAWGYDVKSVPSVDDRIIACQQDLEAPTACWARLDQYLMDQVAPALPLLFGEGSWILSDRVREFSFAQAFGAPALDHFVIDESAR